MSFLQKVAPLLDQVGLHIGFSKKGGTYFLTLLPVSAAEGQDEDLYSRLTPIMLSGTLEELEGATFEEGFAVLQEGVKHIANANAFLEQAKALEEAAKNKKPEIRKSTPNDKPATKATTNGSVDVLSAKAPPKKPELTRTKFNEFMALAALGYRAVVKVQKELPNWHVSEDMKKQLEKVLEENKDRGRPIEMFQEEKKGEA